MNLPNNTEQSKLEPLPWVRGPYGEVICKQDLPKPPGPGERFVVSIKAKIVCAIQGDLITFDEALDYYDLSKEELNSWIKGYKANGMDGLKVTRGRSQFKRDKSTKVSGITKENIRCLRFARDFIKGIIPREEAVRHIGCPAKFERYLNKYNEFLNYKEALTKTSTK